MKRAKITRGDAWRLACVGLMAVALEDGCFLLLEWAFPGQGQAASLPVASVAAVLTAVPIWWWLVLRAQPTTTSGRIARGAVAGFMASLAAHPVAWLLTFFGMLLFDVKSSLTLLTAILSTLLVSLISYGSFGALGSLPAIFLGAVLAHVLRPRDGAAPVNDLDTRKPDSAPHAFPVEA